MAALMDIEGDLRLRRVCFNESVLHEAHPSNSNHWADSSGNANNPNKGLTPLGKDAVRERNRLGLIVDISHVSDKTFGDARETSQAPVFA